ncbi:MAG: sn-glycerol-3-phosphate ABC transporter ATP-binding protein UgpC [Planctomycetes bacterium]|nr:sn-glycerol-3-phosphate ABC transporter ATP-binding protein UgpC [Planctomycetota bacterium]NOG54759.1 sn-glycerol-3-phosphate ABC transporter ATP-binding protein UgpC [Planctomycetota bacterium]
MARVVLDEVTKEFAGGVTAVDRVSIEITDGEFLVLVGPSGCGKSTTLRMVAGLEDITAGRISIGDRVVNSVHPRDRDIAMVFQNYALYPHMTVYKNMAFALKMRSMQRQQIEERVRHAAGILGIEDLLHRKPRELSGGQRQRVALGRAIVREPAAFLFDEPLSNLDAKLRVEMRAELKRLHMRLKTTTIYVTHDQEEAMTLGDRVAIMCQGIVQQIGPPLVIYRQPANRFVAGFLGTPPMNFIEGHLKACDGGVEFVESVSDSAGSLAPLSMRLPVSTAVLDAARAASSDVAAGGATGLHQSGPVTLGIRPEALIPCEIDSSESGGPGLGCRARLNVLVTEPLGDRMDLFMESGGGNRIVARVSSDVAVSAGSEAAFDVDADRLHLFAPGPFGARIPMKPAAVTA